MQDFLLIFEGGDPDWAKNMSPEQMQAVMQEWGVWFESLEKSGNLRNPGAALENSGAAVKADGDRIVTDSLSSELKELIGGFSVICAESLEQATELAKGAPTLRHEPGTRVVIRPIFEMPNG